ncbi:hypothetical protein M430DRAFT_107069, partial [Amorphotheca resinae ATCC 22711]
HSEKLIESNNQAWNFSIFVYGPRPRPDYSAGFDRSAFTDEQYKCLHPLIGDFDAISSHGKWQIHFPFLMCETKASPSILEIADRQNAHSMTLAVGVVVRLYRLVNREKELHQEILAFSISHDACCARICGHYPK